MKIFFLRHGQAKHDKDGILRSDEINGDGLTDYGKIQVGESAKVIKSFGVVRIFSSDTLRTRESTRIVNDELGLSDDCIQYDKDLREVNAGELAKQGKSLACLREVCDANRESEYGIETQEEMYVRACRVLNRYKTQFNEIAKEKDANVLFSGHGYFNCMLRYCISEGLDKPFDRNEYREQYAIGVTNASILMIDMDCKPEFRKAEFVHGGLRTKNASKEDAK